MIENNHTSGLTGTALNSSFAEDDNFTENLIEQQHYPVEKKNTSNSSSSAHKVSEHPQEEAN